MVRFDSFFDSAAVHLVVVVVVYFFEKDYLIAKR